jgi:hypothetical protein
MPEPKPVEKILGKEMSRREFIGFMGAAGLAITGVAGLIRGLSGLGQRVDRGYGASPYGGGAESERSRH